MRTTIEHHDGEPIARLYGRTADDGSGRVEYDLYVYPADERARVLTADQYRRYVIQYLNNPSAYRITHEG